MARGLASDRASDLASDLASDRATDLVSDMASDLGGAMLSALMVLALLLAFETTERLEPSRRAIVGPLAPDITEALPGRYTASMLLPSKSMTAALKYPDCESRILGSPWIFAPAFRALMKNEPTASFDGAGKATWTAPGGDLWLLLALSKDRVFLCIYHSPRLSLGHPEISRLPLLLTETYIIVMSTDELISQWL